MAQSWPPKKIAIVYDRVNTRHGGAELVLLAIAQIFPTADLVTAVADLKTAQWAKIFPHVITSWLQKFPGAGRSHRWLAQFMPLAFETIDFSPYDLIISVTSAEAKGIITTPNQLHVCYLLAPPRYLYHQQTELMAASWPLKIPGLNWLARQALNYLKWWDQVSIHRPDIIIPLSKRVADQIEQFYYPVPKTVATVLYPPINLPQSQKADAVSNLNLPKNFFLQVARLVPYKKIALSLEAAALANQNLIIAGDGPDLKSLRQLAQKLNHKTQAKLQILGSVTEQELTDLYRHCLAVLIPGEEDFGLTALEANAYGKPVIINQLSGSAEAISDKIHGLHLVGPSPKNLSQLMLMALAHPWNPDLLRQNAAKYGTSIFVTALTQRLKTYWQRYNK